MATNTRKLAALLGASGANIADAGTINTAGITNDAINADKIVANAVGTSEVADNVLTATDLAANSVSSSELDADIRAGKVITTEVKPHIIPGVLHPSYVASGTSNKLLDGTTDHSGAFGTEQSDGRKYYYTNIAGSKPIKDPRIGAYFGSQRHMFKSIQILEQETASHGDYVYSIDGRDWMKGVGNLEYVNDTRNVQLKLESATTSFFEITGYFSAFNFLNFTSDSVRNLKVELDGVTAHATFNPNGAANSPLGSRYVSAGSVLNVPLTASGSSLSSDTTLGIHTIRISWVSGTNYPTGCELIVQDTSSTANRSKIQIPAQNVVSFGKKFSISATSAHYDPFTTMSYGGSGTTASALANLIDTDTSLGMDNWKAGGSNYHRPWNGGRVIKWVDSSGTIKTSVNMMPPNAQNITTTAQSAGNNGDAVSDAHVIAGTNDNTINFNTSAIDHSLSEVAKTFIWREFGNGAANGGAGATYADASMLHGTSDDITYVMDDGLTSLSGITVAHNDTESMFTITPGTSRYYITFIGTGLSVVAPRPTTGTSQTLAQNLPFGTHVLEVFRDSSATPIKLDGVQLSANYSNLNSFYEITFHQPKRPPIPEDCVVLADYMLMADFVAQSASGVDKISKGTRRLDASRDMFYNSSSQALDYNSTNYRGFTRVYSSSNNKVFKIPSFGRGGIVGFYGASDKAQGLTFKINGTTASGTTNYNHYHDSSVETDGTFNQRTGSNTGGKFLGAVHKTEISVGGVELSDTTTEQMTFECIDLVSPIHTSHHYQTFEAPLLKELVGGDRNMEQTNLVCSSDGKTWDEVSRDTSYIGNAVLKTAHANTHDNVVNIFDDWRGGKAGTYNGEYFNKDFAIGYDRMICLKEGNYLITFLIRSNKNDDIAAIKANGQLIKISKSTVGEVSQQTTVTINLKRGDYIQGFGVSGGGTGAYEVLTNFQIIRL